MTKNAIRILVVVAATMAVMIQAAPQTDKYTTKYDNVDIDEILNNERLFNSYFKCLMETGKCTTDGEELKRLLPEALENECGKCSEKQKKGAEKVFKFMSEKKTEMWKQLEEKYDPQGLYRQRLEKLVQA